ncbi:YojF family protein [Halalkalibacter sp. APA_J-10(15)]|uniref:YojF family protein n=1 Tax=unclassified Halalkalibacter TaxID=2893063 RepID=UPI001FF50BD6|nr:YojF family protein [Halalkalibacter sp. APA_J-10(15)]MCK0471966.1 YojF family protein [Halalkalibacter sp. APA_J-10(15)]
MESILVEEVQHTLNSNCNKPVYIHLETTNGAYASHNDESFFSAGAFIRNAQVIYSHGKVAGEGPYRVGLKLEIGWIYAEGLTHYEIDAENRLLLAGHGADGKLAVALQISENPFT